MIKFLKNLFGMDKPRESTPSTLPLGVAPHTATEVPYKIETPVVPVAEPVKVETATPVETPKAKAPAKPKAPAAPKAKAPAKPKAPRKPRMTVAK